MSNIIDLPSKQKDLDETLANSVTTPETEANEAQTFDPLNLEMIKRGIRSGLERLEKAIETENTANVAPAIQRTLTNLQKLVDLLEHDVVGMIKSVESQAAAQWTTQAHLQTLLETLKENSVVTNEQLETTWKKVITPIVEDMNSQP